MTGSVAKKYGDKFALLYCAEAPVCKEADQVLKYFAPIVGVQEFGASVSASASNYTAACQAVKSFGAQSIEYGQVSPVALRIADDCASQNIKPQILETSGTADTSWLKDPAVSGEINIEVLAPPMDMSQPGTKAYNQLLATSSLTGTKPDEGAYAGLELFAAAVKASGAAQVTPATLKQGLYSLKGETLGGLTPPLTFKSGQPNSVNCWFTSAIAAGAFTTPDGLMTQCAPENVITTAEKAFKL